MFTFLLFLFFFFNDTATTEIYTLSLHDALPIYPSPRRLARGALVHAHHLGDLLADGEHRVERRHRLLEDHRDPVPADSPDVLLPERQQVAPLEQHAAPRFDAARRAYEAQHRERGHRLAAPRLTDD